MKSKLFGDRFFYKRVLALSLPIMIQTGITNFVNMLDNVMVGQVGTVQMTGVAVANQLIFVFNLCIFGACSGAGIFGAQFFGNEDHKGVRDTFRFKLLFCSLLTVLFLLVFAFAGKPLIDLYLRGDGNTADAAASLSYAYKYLLYMLIGLLPYTVSQCYFSVLRETGRTVPPMVAGVSAVAVNLVLNYILIFGHFGAPKLGVAGAAIATVISRYVELVIIVVWTHLNREKNLFAEGTYKSFKIPRGLVKQIFVYGMPLMLNEALWSAGIATVNQCYSVLGLSVVAANNICQTFWNVFSVAFTAVGSAIGIILGQLLGADKAAEAKEESRRLIAFSVMASIAVAIIYIPLAELIPMIYNTEPEIRETATRLMQIGAICMPLDAFAHASYFTLRSGGKTFITFLFDSCFVWVVNVPVAFCLTRYTSLGILAVFAVCQSLSLIKCVLGAWLVEKGIWLNNIIDKESTVNA